MLQCFCKGSNLESFEPEASRRCGFCMSVKHFLLHCLIILKHCLIDKNFYIIIYLVRICMNHNLAKLSSLLLPLHIFCCLRNSLLQLRLKGLCEVADSRLATFCHWTSHALEEYMNRIQAQYGSHLFYSMFPS